MDERVRPSPRLAPLPPDPALKEPFEASKKSLGFIPNSLLIMQRKPKLAKALAQLTAAIWDPEGKVDRGFKRLVDLTRSRAQRAQHAQHHIQVGLGGNVQLLGHACPGRAGAGRTRDASWTSVYRDQCDQRC